MKGSLTNPDITAYRRRRVLGLWIPTLLWMVLIAAVELFFLYAYTYEKLGIVTAVGLWIVLSLILPIRLGLLNFMFDVSWEGNVLRIKDRKRWVPQYSGGKWRYEVDMYIEKTNGRTIKKTMECEQNKVVITRNMISPQMYHVGDRVVYLRGTYVPFIVSRDGEAPPAVCVLCGKDNPAGTETCLSCHAKILREQISN